MAPFASLDGQWFEVISDVLYLDGRIHHRGDLLSALELAGRVEKMLQIGMIRSVAANRLVA